MNRKFLNLFPRINTIVGFGTIIPGNITLFDSIVMRNIPKLVCAYIVVVSSEFSVIRGFYVKSAGLFFYV